MRACPSYSSPLPSKRAVLPTELTAAFCHSVFLFSLINALTTSEKLPTEGWQVLFILEYVPVFTLSPRFIMSIRELYTHDVQGRRGEGIDTGFGLSSDCGAGRSTIVFVDVEQNEGSEHIEEVPRGVATTSSSGPGAGGTAIVFADVEQNEGSEDIEKVPRGLTTTSSSGRDVGGTPVVFVDVEQNGGSEDIEEVTREVQVMTRPE